MKSIQTSRLGALGGAMAAALAFAAPVQAQDARQPVAPQPVAGLPATSPESVGMSSERLGKMDAYLDGLVKENLFQGVSMVATRHGKVFYNHSVGFSDVAKKVPQTNATIGRMYSMTKSVTGVAMMILWEEGKWSPEDPISRYIPEFANLKVLKSMGADGKMVLEEPDHQPTMGELMSFTAGFGYGLGGPADWAYHMYDDPRTGTNYLFTAKDWKPFIDKVAATPLIYQPGTKFAYSISADLQAYILEKITGENIEAFEKKHIFEPLGMKDSYFFVPRDKASRVSTFFARTEDGKLIASPMATNYDGKFAQGGGGLWSTNADYLRFAQMLANGGTLDGHRILGPETVRFMMSTNMTEDMGSSPYSAEQLPHGMKFAYDGAVYTSPALAGCPCGKGTYWWAGAGGTWYWVDPTNDIVVTGFVQRLDFTGTTPLTALTTRPGIYQALIDPAK